MKSEKRTEYLLILLLTIISGSLFSVVKAGLHYFTPFQLILVRFLPTIPIFFWICWKARNLFKTLTTGDWLKIGAAGLFGTIVHNLSINYGQTHVGAGIASLMDAMNPPAILLLAIIFRHERVGWNFYFGIIIAFIGVFVLTLTKTGFGFDQTTSTGVLILLIAPVTWAIYTILLADIIPKVGVTQAPAACVLAGSILLLPTTPFAFHDGFPSGWMPWFCLGMLSLLSTVTAFTIWSWLLKRRGAAHTGIIEYLNVIWGVTFAITLMGETLTWQMVLGAILILAGVAMTQKK